MPERRVAVLVGSLRKASYNRRIALALEKLAPASLRLQIVEIGALPLYNEDLEGDHAPAQWLAFRAAIRERDAVLFVTPEYNRSVPGGLKNAIDVGSRPYGQSVWSRKPCAVISVSPGAIGGFGQPPPAPVAGLSRHAGAAAAGGLRRRRRDPVRRGRLDRQRGLAQVPHRPAGSVRGPDRAGAGVGGG
jgi:hypothetical protein